MKNTPCVEPVFLDCRFALHTRDEIDGHYRPTHLGIVVAESGNFGYNTLQSLHL